MVHGCLGFSPNQSMSSTTYRYPMRTEPQSKYRKVSVNDDMLVQTMITKHVQSQPHIKTLELLVETSNLQLELNTIVGTSQEIILYDISSQPPSLGMCSQLLHSTDNDEQRVHSQLTTQLEDIPYFSHPCMDDFTNEKECFPTMMIRVMMMVLRVG